MPTTNPILSAGTLPAGNIVENPVPTASIPHSNLTQNDFLKLLVAQMSAQDPLNPQSNTDFAAQMAQFSALQTSQATQTDISQLQASQQVQQANSLIGRSVTLVAQDGSTPTGLVTGVQMVSGVPKILVNGSLYDLGQVLAISATLPPTTPSPVTPPTTTQPPTHPALPYAT